MASKTLTSLLGKFVQFAEDFSLTDLHGESVDMIIAGETVVHGPWRVVTKDQIARVWGIVTPGMLNAEHAKKPDERAFEFQGNGWRPQADTGDVLLQDVDNESDRWACKPELFGETGWNGAVDFAVTYSKPGKPRLALEIPEGTTVTSLEGSRPAPAGCLLVFGNANKGDFFVLTSDVVENYVRGYVEPEAAAGE